MNRLIIIGFASLLLCACNPSTQNQKEMAKQREKIGMVEITTFKLNRGITEKDFEKAALSMQELFLEKQEGFVKRTLTLSSDSIWTDIVYWQDQESFENTMQQAEKSETVVPFMEKIDFNSIKMNITTPLLLEK